MFITTSLTYNIHTTIVVTVRRRPNHAKLGTGLAGSCWGLVLTQRRNLTQKENLVLPLRWSLTQMRNLRRVKPPTHILWACKGALRDLESRNLTRLLTLLELTKRRTRRL